MVQSGMGMWTREREGESETKLCYIQQKDNKTWPLNNTHAYSTNVHPPNASNWNQWFFESTRNIKTNLQTIDASSFFFRNIVRQRDSAEKNIMEFIN